MVIIHPGAAVRRTIGVLSLVMMGIVAFRFGVIDLPRGRQRHRSKDGDSIPMVSNVGYKDSKRAHKSNQKMLDLCHTYWKGGRDSNLAHSSVSYSWIGNTWIPPAGIPRYTPGDMRRLLRGENVLFVGDSTARQDYFTMYNLMNATNEQNIVFDELNQQINVNKAKITENCTLRADKVSNILSACRKVPTLEHVRNNRTTWELHQPGYSIVQTGAYDLTKNPEPYNCFGNVPLFINKSYDIISESFSVLVFSLGIWEAVKHDACPKSGKDGLLAALNYLKEFSDATNITVIWKTHGGGSRETRYQRRFTSSVHGRTRDWFEANQPVHMVLADFGTQVLPRTYGEDRIFGDSINHFGPNARTLSIQMITEALYGQRCREI